MEKYYLANLNLWNEWTEIHKRSTMYDLEGFLQGGQRLHSIELEELGDVRGKSLLHLQCHFGLDTLSWARLGAQVTGVDFSDRAIQLARQVAEQTGLQARFIQSNLFDLPAVLDDTFDIVFTSYGVLGWLHDLPAWGRLISRYLKPGGTFYIVEFHPFSYIFEMTPDGSGLQVAYRYFPQAEPEQFPVEGSYADRNAKVNQPVEYAWPHSLSEVLNALLQAGLCLEYVHEFPFTVEDSNFIELMEPVAGGYYRFKEHSQSIPLLFSLKAVK